MQTVMGVDLFSKLRGPSNTARSSGERCKTPSGVRGRVSAANAFWVHLEPKIASDIDKDCVHCVS